MDEAGPGQVRGEYTVQGALRQGRLNPAGLQRNGRHIPPGCTVVTIASNRRVRQTRERSGTALARFQIRRAQGWNDRLRLQATHILSGGRLAGACREPGLYHGVDGTGYSEGMPLPGAQEGCFGVKVSRRHLRKRWAAWLKYPPPKT